LAALDLGAAIRLSHRPEPSGRAVHEVVRGLDIRGHGRRFVLLHQTHRPQRRPYPFVQAGAETSHASAEVVEPGPGCSWEGHSGGWMPVSGMKMQSLVGLCTHFAFHWWSAQCATRMLWLSDKLMNCYAAGTKRCPNLGRGIFALDSQVSAEWSRCWKLC